MGKHLSARERLALISEVKSNRKSVKSACKKYKISRTTFYKWLSLYEKLQKEVKTQAQTDINLVLKPRHYKSFSPEIEANVVEIINNNPSLSIRKLQQKILQDLKLEKSISIHYIHNLKKSLVKRKITILARPHFRGFKVLSKNDRLAMIQEARSGAKVTEICAKYGVSRVTFYKWLQRFNKPQGIEGLTDRRKRGEKHWKSLDDTKRQLILDTVISHPEFSVKKVVESLPKFEGKPAVHIHGVFNVLKTFNLNTYEKRVWYSRQNQRQAQEIPAPAKAMEPIPMPAVEKPITIHGPPIKVAFQLIKAFFSFTFFSKTNAIISLFSVLGFSIISVGFVGMLAKAQPGTHLGLISASISLTFGFFFFLYSLKYYLTIALVLGFSKKLPDNGKNGNGSSSNGTLLSKIFKLGNGNGNSHNGNGNGGKGLLAKIFGVKNGNGYVNGNGINGNGYTNGNTILDTRGIGLISNLEGISLDSHPFVSIHLATYNEKRVIDRLLTAATTQDYDNYEVVVVDDSTDETVDILNRWSSHPKVKVIHRPDRSGFKGGALKVALENTDPSSEFVIVFDADFIPYPDTITQFLKYFKAATGKLSSFQDYKDSNIAAIQGYQWHVLNKSENWLTRGVRSEFAGSYVMERSGNEVLGALKQIAGSVYMIRRDILQGFGWGTSITEDFELTLKIYEAGYKVIYTPYIQAPSECVSTVKRLIRQRMRWAEGHTHNIRKMFTRLLTSPNMTKSEKMEFFYLSPYYLQSVFFMVGTLCWFLSETVLKTKLPFWTSLWGWSLVFSNLLSLPLMNSVGLFLEESEEKDYLGILSFITMSYLLVPFQAYASIKGLIEKEEGPWFRTPKTGKITDTLTRGHFYRWLNILLPWRGNRGVIKQELPNHNLSLNPYLSLSSANSRFNTFRVARRPKLNDPISLLLLGMISFSIVLFYISINKVITNEFSSLSAIYAPLILKSLVLTGVISSLLSLLSKRIRQKVLTKQGMALLLLLSIFNLYIYGTFSDPNFFNKATKPLTASNVHAQENQRTIIDSKDFNAQISDSTRDISSDYQFESALEKGKGKVRFSNKKEKSVGYRLSAQDEKKWIEFKLNNHKHKDVVMAKNGKITFNVEKYLDVKYEVREDRVKEDIIIKEKLPPFTTISFDYKVAKGLLTIKEQDGSYSIVEKDNVNKVYFKILPADIKDKDGKNGAINLNLDQDKQLATFDIDQNFLNNANYPVTIDPTSVATVSLVNWTYKKPITIDNTGNSNALTNYQVLVNLDSQTLIDAGKMQADCDDILFKDSDDSTTINHWLETNCALNSQDTFSDNVDPFWTQDKGNSTTATYTETGGNIEIFHPGTSNTNSANRNNDVMLRHPINTTSDFTFTAKQVSYTTPANRWRNGLMLYKDRDNFIWIGHYKDIGSEYVSVLEFLNGTWTQRGTDFAWPGFPMYFRIQRTGSTYTFDRSTDGSTWTNQYSASLSWTPTNFGLNVDQWFSNLSYTTKFDYVTWSPSENSKIWVKVPSIPASSSKTIYLYYGNSGATSTSSITNTFTSNTIWHGTGSCNAAYCNDTMDDHTDADTVRSSVSITSSGTTTALNDATGGDNFIRRYRFLFVPSSTASYQFATNSDDGSEVSFPFYDSYGGGINTAHPYGAHYTVANWYGGHGTGTCGTSGSPGKRNLVANSGYWIDYVMSEGAGGNQAQMCINDGSWKTVNTTNFSGMLFTRLYPASGAEPTITVTGETTGADIFRGQRSLLRDSSGNYYAIYYDGNNDINVKKSTDSGATWGAATTQTETVSNLSADMDSSNDIHIVAESSSNIVYYKFTTASSTYSSVITLDGSGSAARPYLTIDANNLPSVSWRYKTSNPSGVRYLRAKGTPTTCTNWSNAADTTATCSASTVTAGWDILGSVAASKEVHAVIGSIPGTPSPGSSGKGDLWIFYQSENDGDFYYVRATIASSGTPTYKWTWGTPTVQLAGNYNSTRYLDLSIVPDSTNNRVVVSWTNDTGTPYTRVAYVSYSGATPTITDISPTTSDFGSQHSLATGTFSATLQYWLAFRNASGYIALRKTPYNSTSWDSSDTTLDQADTSLSYPTLKKDDGGSKLDILYLQGNYPNNLYYYTYHMNQIYSKDGVATASTPSPSWYNTSWAYRKKLTVQSSKVPATLTDFPVYVSLADLGSDFFSYVKSDGTDIVVTSSDGTTKLNRELESINTGSRTGALWFNASSLSSTSNTDFYIYYGNSSGAETNSTSTWNTNYKMVQHLANGITLTATDSTSNANNGTLVNTPTATNGKIYGAANFNGTNAGINLPLTALFGGGASSQATISMWFNATSWGTKDYLWVYDKSDAPEMRIIADNSNLAFYGYSGAAYQFQLSTTSPTAGVWHYLTATWKDNDARLYLDGVQVANDISTTITDAIPTSHNLLIYTRDAANTFFGGSMDEVRINNTSRSADWITAEYNNQSSTSTFYTIATGDIGNADRTILLTEAGYTNVSDDDTARESQAASSNSTYPMFIFKVYNSNRNNTDPTPVTWIGQVDVTNTASYPTKLQVWNNTTKVWVDVASNTSTVANTDFTLQDLNLTGTAYYDSNYFIYFRVFATPNSSDVKTLKTNYFNQSSTPVPENVLFLVIFIAFMPLLSKKFRKKFQKKAVLAILLVITLEVNYLAFFSTPAVQNVLNSPAGKTILSSKDHGGQAYASSDKNKDEPVPLEDSSGQGSSEYKFSGMITDNVEVGVLDKVTNSIQIGARNIKENVKLKIELPNSLNSSPKKIEGEKATFDTEGQQIIWSLEKQRVTQQIILTEKPKNNVIQFDIKGDNLIFEKQTDGSYIVRKENGGEALFKIDTPTIQDSKEIPALEIKNKKIEITISESFLDGATYPVTINQTIISVIDSLNLKQPTTLEGDNFEYKSKLLHSTGIVEIGDKEKDEVGYKITTIKEPKRSLKFSFKGAKASDKSSNVKGEKIEYDIDSITKVKYQVLENGVKEDIILSQKPPVGTLFQFDYVTEGEMNLINLQSDGSWVFEDPKTTGLTYFKILPPTITDSNGQKGTIKLNMDEEKHLATFDIDQAFLNTATYPVTIDPTSIATVNPEGTQFVQVIDIIKTNYSGSDTSYTPSGTTCLGENNCQNILGEFRWTSGSYTGATVYFEAVLKSDSGWPITGYASLFTEAGVEVSGAAVSTENTTYTRLRSGSITLTNATNYNVRVKSSVTSTSATVWTARVIVVQSSTSITNTETNIPYGPQTDTGSTSYTTITNSPKWYFDSSKYDTLTAYFQATMRRTGGTGTPTAYAQLYNNTDSEAVTGSEVTTNSNSFVLIRSGALTIGSSAGNLKTGKEYVVQIKVAGASGPGVSFVKAHVTLVQSNGGSALTKIRTYQPFRYNTATGTTYARANLTLQFDPTEWSNITNTYYFEATLGTSANTGYAKLKDETNSTDITSSEISTTSTSITRVTSSALSGFPSTNGSAIEFDLENKVSSAATVTISQAWLIVDISIGGLTDAYKFRGERTLLRDSSGNYYAIYVDGSSDINVKKSTDKGATWAAATTQTEDVQNLSSDIDSSNNLHIAAETTGGNIVYYKFTTATSTYSSAVSISGSGDAYRPYLVVDANNFPSVSWSTKMDVRFSHASADPTTLSNWTSANGTVDTASTKKITLQNELLNQTYSNSGTGYTPSGTSCFGLSTCQNILGEFRYVSANYTSPTIYFEAVITTDNTYTGYASLFTEAGVEVTSAAVSTTSTSYTRLRSGSITLTNATNYNARTKNSGSFNSTYIRAARLIIVQSGTTITNTEIAVPIGDYTSTNSSSYTTLTDATRWYFDSSKYDGTLTAYFQATMRRTGGTGTPTAYAQLYNNTDSEAVTGSAVSTTSGSHALTRSGAITVGADSGELKSGKEYVVQFRIRGDSGPGVEMASAQIVIVQSRTGGITKTRIYHPELSFTKTDADSTYTAQGFDNQFDPTTNEWQNVTNTYYFEASMKTSAGTGYAKLKDEDTPADITNAEITTTSTSMTRRTSSALSSMPASAKKLDTELKNNATNTTTVEHSWLIIDSVIGNGSFDALGTVSSATSINAVLSRIPGTPNVGVSGNGDLWIFYQNGSDGDLYYIRGTIATGYKWTWGTPTVQLAGDFDSERYLDLASAWETTNNRALFAWTNKSGASTYTRMAYISYSGATPSITDISPTTTDYGKQLSVASGTYNGALQYYLFYRTSNWYIALRYTPASSTSWSSETILDQADSSLSWPALKVDDAPTATPKLDVLYLQGNYANNLYFHTWHMNQTYSEQAVSAVPTTTTDLTKYFDELGYKNATTDDTSYEAVTATSSQYAMSIFKDYAGNDLDTLTATWIGQSTVAASTSNVYLQVYRFGATNAWVTQVTNSTALANTDFTMATTINTNMTEYADTNKWVYFRVYAATGSALTLNTDYWNNAITVVPEKVLFLLLLVPFMPRILRRIRTRRKDETVIQALTSELKEIKKDILNFAKKILGRIFVKQKAFP